MKLSHSCQHYPHQLIEMSGKEKKREEKHWIETEQIVKLNPIVSIITPNLNKC